MSYFTYNSLRNSEQNKVWIGLSKETAHQLGTPTSSLMAWVELLKDSNCNLDIVNHLEQDVLRLEKITNRFSKIGSKPILKNESIFKTVAESLYYLEARMSSKVNYSINKDFDDDIPIPINKSLFSWVIENLVKNSLDAMNGDGNLTINISDNDQYVHIDINDTGKGIPKSKYKTIFKPGYTTKERGWGLGLSLSHRIVETYHSGKIFVQNSEVGKGTSIRIVLTKLQA